MILLLEVVLYFKIQVCSNFLHLKKKWTLIPHSPIANSPFPDIHPIFLFTFAKSFLRRALFTCCLTFHSLPHSSLAGHSHHLRCPSDHHLSPYNQYHCALSGLILGSLSTQLTLPLSWHTVFSWFSWSCIISLPFWPFFVSHLLLFGNPQGSLLSSFSLFS